MKRIITFFICIASLSSVYSTNYYVSASGSDGNSGTASSSPWQTITKLNTVSYTPGDTIFFKAGDTFRGNIIISESGTSGSKIVFTSYGTGNKPVISGAEPVVNWTLNGMIYQAPFPQAVTGFFVNNKEQTIARYPNDHQYLSLDTAAVGYLEDAALTSLSSSLITGSKVCVHTEQWCWEKSSVNSFLGNKITYANSMLPALVGFGYFLYDNISHLDTAYEWKYDAFNQVLNYIPPSGQDPNTMNCEASAYSNGIQLGLNVSHINIINLAFEKQTNAGVSITNSSNKYIKIENCFFARQYNHGVNDKGKYSEISNCYFREIGGIAVFVNGSGVASSIHHNIFRNIGPFRNGGIGTQINLSAIKTGSVDSCHIHHNDIDSTGYCGIAADGGYHLVERNIVKNAMLCNNDGAALKSFGTGTEYTTFRNNFVSKSDGNTEGTFKGKFGTPGIYFDFNVNNSTIEHNTIYDRNKLGIFQNAGTNNNTIQHNVVYGGSFSLVIDGGPQVGTPIANITVKHNNFFALNDSAYLVRQIDYNNIFTQGFIDSNYYFQPYNSGQYVIRKYGALDSVYSFSEWLTTGNDTYSKSSFVSWSPSENYSRLFMNQTDNVMNISLNDTMFLDLDSNVICGSIELQPYTSKILISTNSICNTVGIDKNIVDELFVFPNPCMDEIFVRTSISSGEIEFNITDQIGRIVVKGFITNETSAIPVNHLASGFYIFQLNGPLRQTVKIIKN